MKRLMILALLAPSCGGGGGSSGGSSQPPLVVAPVVSLDSVAPNPFTPPAKGTVTYTLSGSSALVGLNAYITSGAPNTYQFLGEVMIGQETVGTGTYDWPGTFPAIGGIQAPLFLIQQIDATHGLYVLSLQTITQETNGSTTTSASPPADLNVYLIVDYAAQTLTVDHAVYAASGNASPFPQSGSVPGLPGWVYFERVQLYDVFWDTSTDLLTYTLNASVIQNWSTALFNTPSISGRQYTLEIHSKTSSSSTFSPLQTVTTN